MYVCVDQPAPSVTPGGHSHLGTHTHSHTTGLQVITDPVCVQQWEDGQKAWTNGETDFSCEPTWSLYTLICFCDTVILHTLFFFYTLTCSLCIHIFFHYTLYCFLCILTCSLFRLTCSLCILTCSLCALISFTQTHLFSMNQLTCSLYKLSQSSVNQSISPYCIYTHSFPWYIHPLPLHAPVFPVCTHLFPLHNCLLPIAAFRSFNCNYKQSSQKNIQISLWILIPNWRYHKFLTLTISHCPHSANIV